MRLGIATDHAGFGLKEELFARLRAAGHELVDFGAHERRLARVASLELERASQKTSV